jgi:electron transfer flavoprotein beta subunit
LGDEMESSNIENKNAGLNIIVLIKQVPDMNNVKFNVEEGKIDRSSAGVEINPFDLNALEAAAQIKDKVGGTVNALSMGPPQAESALQEAMVRGADRGILLTDKKFGGADTLATSYTLAKAIKKIVGNYDLVITGEKTVDGDTGQIGPEVAEHLGIPHVSYVNSIKKCEKEKITVSFEIGNSNYIIEIKFPGLITVTKDINEPRYVSSSKKARAKKLQVEKYTMNDIDDYNEDKFGVKGSPTWVFKIVIPPENTGNGKIFVGSHEETAQKLLNELEGIL